VRIRTEFFREGCETGTGNRLFSCMPLFFFDIREDGVFYQDEEGSEHPGLGSAEREATETAASIARDLLSRGTVRLVAVEVRNEHGQRMLTATVSIRVERAELNDDGIGVPRNVRVPSGGGDGGRSHRPARPRPQLDQDRKPD